MKLWDKEIENERRKELKRKKERERNGKKDWKRTQRKVEKERKKIIHKVKREERKKERKKVKLKKTVEIRRMLLTNKKVETMVQSKTMNIHFLFHFVATWLMWKDQKFWWKKWNALLH